MGLKQFGLAIAVSAALPATAFAQACGRDFATWRAGMVDEARAAGVGQTGLNALASARTDSKVLQRDRSQGVFTLDFLTFSQRLISSNRMENGRRNLQRYRSTFDRVVADYGVSPEVITAFWAFETDYGAVQGDFLTLNALATLAHDCRRPELFRPQLLALAKLIDADVLPPDIRGAWAGEIGQIQVLPEDYLKKGVDGDGDGRIRMKTSAEDAIMTAGNFLSSLGWQANQPWMIEVTVPNDKAWQDIGLGVELPVSEWISRGIKERHGSLDPNQRASLLMPMGKKGPAFLAFPNFRILLEWNQSLTYVTTVAYFANRIGGAPRYNAGSGHNGLSGDQMKELQRRLQARGYDVGDVDGILGAGTRAAVRAEQLRLGLPADSWPTPELLRAL
ncbi:MAG: lytic murein transglycosylase [Pseudomonadota bacterium]